MPRFNPLALCLLLALGLGSAPLAAQDTQPSPDTAAMPAGGEAATYDVDPAHTSVYFKVTHLDISQVFGRFDEFSGTYHTDGEAMLDSFDFTVQTASVNTGNEKRDAHLNSDDFFNAVKFPKITLKSKSVTPADQTENRNMFDVTADLTLHGVTKPVEIQVQQGGSAEGMRGEQRTGYSTTFTVDRRDFGLDAWQGMVGNDVTLMISWEGVLQEGDEDKADSTP